VPLYIDSNSALKLTRNPEFHSKSKHIDVKHHFIREKVESKEIDTQRVNTKDNLADILTKPLARPTHEDLVERLGMGRGSRHINGRTLTLFSQSSSLITKASIKLLAANLIVNSQVSKPTPSRAKAGLTSA
jgi:hypothetical protein